MVLYRIDGWVSSSMYSEESGFRMSECNLRIVEYFVTKETKKGYWVRMMVNGQPIGYETKWMSKSATRRFAHNSHEEAYRAFILRKQKYARILKSRLDDARQFIEIAQHRLENDYA